MRGNVACLVGDRIDCIKSTGEAEGYWLCIEAARRDVHDGRWIWRGIE